MAEVQRLAVLKGGALFFEVEAERPSAEMLDGVLQRADESVEWDIGEIVGQWQGSV